MMRRDIKKILLIAVLLAVFFLFNRSQAVNEDFSVEFSPSAPGPNTSVSATLVSYSFDVNRASITWNLNGQTKLRGTGQKNFSFTTGNLGSRTNISVSITSEDGAQLQKNFSFQAADVDILWEALNYTPLTYKGKALPVSGSLIRITAIPYFPSSSGLVYEWQIDYKNVPDISGTGKNSFVFKSADIYNKNKIGLTVSNYDRSIVAKKSVDIEIGAPKIIFYEESLLEGVKYNRALRGNVQLEEDEIIVRIEPYFFSVNDLEKIFYEWLMNGKKIIPEEFFNILSLRRGESSGQSLIKVSANNPSNILQYADNNLEINY